MKRVCYLESRKNLFNFSSNQQKHQLNIFFHDRLEGLMGEFFREHKIDLEWLNNSVDPSHFIESGEYKDYDGLILTAPDARTQRSLEKIHKNYPVVVSQDYPLDSDLNYVGPDHLVDAGKVMNEIVKGGDSRACLLIGVCNERSRTYIRAFETAFKEQKLPFNEHAVIGCDLKTMNSSYPDISGSEKVDIIIQEILKRKDTGVYILIEPLHTTELYGKLVNLNNVRIPQDAKFINMGGPGNFPRDPTDYTRHMDAIHQNFKELGAASLRLINEILEGSRPFTGNKIKIPGTYMKKESLVSPVALDKESPVYFKSSVAGYISENYKNAISGKDVARSLELSYKYFLTKFKECFGCKLGDYVNRIRLDKAAFLITHTGKSIVDIYTEVGFVNKATFLNNFKKRFNMTPGEYRSSAAG